MSTLKEKVKNSCKLASFSAAVATVTSLIFAVDGIVDLFSITEAIEIADTICDITYNIMITAAMMVVLVMFGKMLKDNTPFTQRSAMLLSIAAGILMLSGLLAPLSRTVALVVLGADITFSFLDTNVFFLCVMIQFVVQIISYGTNLQQESDETL